MPYMRDATGRRLDSFEVSEAAPQPVITMSRLPGFGRGDYQMNGASYTDTQLWTHNDVQYAVWVNDAGRATVGKRTLPDGAWSTFDLFTVAGNPLGTGGAPNDFHNTYRIAVDSAGYIHVWGGFHSAALKYVRSTSPNNITAWADAASAMPSGASNAYPTAVMGNDGTLLFFYRQGTSANGDLYLNRLSNPATNTWVAVRKVIDGTSDSLSPYWNHIVVERDGQPHPGRIHLSWCWRSGTPYNRHVCYAYSDDNGVTWRKSDGTVYAAAPRIGTADTVVTTPASDQGLLNTYGADVDTLGRYHTTYFIRDGSTATQIHHVWRDEDGDWHDDTVTRFTYSYDPFGTTGTNGAVSGIVARPAVACSPNGRTYLIYRHQFEQRRGTVRAIDVTPGLTNWPDFPIMQLDLQTWEPVVDPQALAERGELHMLICPTQVQGAGSPGTEFIDTTLWSAQFIAVVSYDLRRMGEVAAGKVKLPRVEPISEDIARTLFTVTSTTSVDLVRPVADVSPPLINISQQDTDGRYLVVKAVLRGNVQAGAGTFTIDIREYDETTTTPRLGIYVPFTHGGNVVKATPWVPLRQIARGNWGWVHLFGFVSAGGTTGRISQGRLMLGYVTL